MLHSHLYTGKMSKLLYLYDSQLKQFRYKPYYKGVWEPVQIPASRMLPFQFLWNNLDPITIYQDSTDITDHFHGNNKITGWTKWAGGGSFTSTGITINSWSAAADDEIKSNQFSLVSGDYIHFKFTGTWASSPDIDMKLFNTNTSDYITMKEGAGADIEYINTVATTGTYEVRLSSDATGTLTTVTTELSDTLLHKESGANDYITYAGTLLYDWLTRGRCYFKFSTSTHEYFSEDCMVGDVYHWGDVWTKEHADTSFTGRSFNIYQNSYIESGRFYCKSGEQIIIALDPGTGFDADAVALTLQYESGGSTAMTEGDRTTMFYAYATTTKNDYVKVRIDFDNPGAGDGNFTDWEILKSYSDKMIKIIASSTVDHAGVHYSDGWDQEYYKFANVSRSPQSALTVTGEERNGQIIVEKVNSSTRYQVTMKVTEPEFNGLLGLVGTTVQITDQSGTTYTCYNIDVSNPSWNNGNGICVFSFDDNINTYTLTNADI